MEAQQGVTSAYLDRLAAGLIQSTVDAIERIFALLSESPPPRVFGKGPTKRAPGELRHTLIGELTRHHQYEEVCVLNPEPIKVRKLAAAAEVSVSTSSEFFRREFGGYKKYRIICLNTGSLLHWLQRLNGEEMPKHLLGLDGDGEVYRPNAD